MTLTWQSVGLYSLIQKILALLWEKKNIQQLHSINSIINQIIINTEKILCNKFLYTDRN